MVGKTDKPTASQRRRLDALGRMRCIACQIDGRDRCGRVEIHHIVDRGNRRASGGHDASIPLGAWHHRGLPPDVRMSLKRAEATYGPSLALNNRAFIARYGNERALLIKVDSLLLEEMLR